MIIDHYLPMVARLVIVTHSVVMRGKSMLQNDRPWRLMTVGNLAYTRDPNFLVASSISRLLIGTSRVLPPWTHGKTRGSPQVV